MGISKKLLLGLVLFAVLLAMAICFIVQYYFHLKINEKYEYTGNAMAETLAAWVDGDKALSYLETGVPDEYYDQVLEDVNDFQEYFEPLYVYIAIPTEDNVLYLWSNGFSGEETIGYTTGYAAGGKEWMIGRLNGEDVERLRFVEDPEFGSIATAAAPIYNSAGEPVALACVDFSVEEITDVLINIIVKINILVFTLVSLYIVINYWYVQRQVVTPIGELTSAAKEMAISLETQEPYKSKIHTGDELEVLSDAFERMDVELRDYFNENMKITAEKERIGAELNMAANIQSSQLPSTFPAFPDRKDFDIHASMTPAKTVGGDFYDFFLVDDDHIALVMADVSGKGIPASLFMMISKLLIQSRVMMGESPAEALSNSNAQLMQNNAAHQFVTVWLAVFDLKTGKGIAANAGHEHPVIRRANGLYELVEYKHNPPVATMKKMKFKDHEFELHPGDSLFVYTDGVAEATNEHDELFGTERMLDALNSDPDASCEQVLNNVMNGINEFVEGAEQFDDITMMSFHYYGPKGN